MIIKENILQADLLDILFDNRNKNYGAYPLRKYYHERMYKALGIVFFFMALLSVYILINKKEIVLTGPYIIPETETGHVLPTPEKRIVPPPPKPTQPNQPNSANSQTYNTIKMVDSTETVSKPTQNLDSVPISNAPDNNGPGNNKKLGERPGSGGHTPSNTVSGNVKPVDKNIVHQAAEVMPSYPGGLSALIKFLQKNLVNPEDLDNDEMVSVKIRFVVGYDGVLKGFETVEDGGKAFNEEVVRVLKKMPAWIPGKTAGENVSVYYTIPVKFVPAE